jgi:hypothetical protein
LAFEEDFKETKIFSLNWYQQDISIDCIEALYFGGETNLEILCKFQLKKNERIARIILNLNSCFSLLEI